MAMLREVNPSDYPANSFSSPNAPSPTSVMDNFASFKNGYRDHTLDNTLLTPTHNKKSSSNKKEEQPTIHDDLDFVTYDGYVQRGDVGANPKHVHLWENHLVAITLLCTKEPGGLTAQQKKKWATYSGRLGQSILACRGCLNKSGSNVIFDTDATKIPGNIARMERMVSEWEHVRTCSNLPEHAVVKFGELCKGKQKRKKTTVFVNDGTRCSDVGGNNGVTFHKPSRGWSLSLIGGIEYEKPLGGEIKMG